ncbi:uncharacterized protein [Pseudorasbora parva]|uniref:uncharacterized protein isoform X1 n=1 Tax=Pseudorasbora parva TaxID=51549 RepID=UPI00351DDA15
MTTKRKKYDLRFKLTVVKFAEKNSGEAAARHFLVDSKRVREWRKKKAELQRQSKEDDKRARLRGGGRKKASEELEASVCEWIHSMRAKHLRVSRKTIRAKAKEVYATVSDGRDEERFTASAGWVDKFLKRNDFSDRRRTPVAQKDAKHFTEKLVNFVTCTTQIIKAKKIQPENIIAMDETAVWFDMAGSTTVDAHKTTGHEKSHLTVVLAAKADGTKLKPYIVFKEGIKEVKSMQNISGVVVATSENGCMSEDLTADWLQRVVGKLNSAPRLLAWDSYRWHISAATKAELKRGYNITTAVIPGGCTKYIQAPDVVWNQPFKASLHESYSNWMAGDVDKEYMAGGYMRAPARRSLVSWVLQAWEKLDTERLKNSFKVCGLTVASDGSEDHLIHCFNEGEPCASGRELLVQARQAELAEAGEGPVEESDEKKDFANELMVFVKEESEDVKIEDTFAVKVEETEEQTELMAVKEESEVLIEMEEKYHYEEHDDFTTGGKSPSQQEEAQQTETLSNFICPQCGKSFAKKGSLKAHMNIHTGEKPHTCPQCGKSFTTKGNLKDHLIVHSEEKPYTCPQCGNGFTQKGSFNRHMRVHTGEKPYSCELCDKSFTTELNLRYHMNSHTGEKPFACDQCGRSFRHKVTHKKHLSTHSSEERYVCHHCGMGFTDGDHLAEHIITHTGGKPFMCHHCAKTLSNKTNLEVHMRVHTGEKPFACPECGKSFRFKGNLQTHIRVHTGEKPYTCLQCQLSFTYQRDLKRHLQTHSGNTVQCASMW